MGFRETRGDPEHKESRSSCLKELKREFSPEFINRIDEIIIFNPLGRERAGQICQLLIDDVNTTLAPKGADVDVDDAAVEWLLQQSGEEPNMGARPLRRAIQKHIEDPVSELLIAARDEKIEGIEVRVGPEGLSVSAREREATALGR